MGDYSELKTLLDACLAKNCDGPREFSKACEALFDACSIETIAGLVAENDALRLRCDRLDADKQAMTEAHVLYTWLRKKCDQPSNDFVAVQMNIGHDWVPVHDLDRDLRTMIDREEP